MRWCGFKSGVEQPIKSSQKTTTQTTNVEPTKVERKTDPIPTKSKITHKWFAPDDFRQEIVQKAYDMWWLDFVALLECENGLWDTKRRWDWGAAIWLCQINTRWHKEPLQKWFDSWETQLDVCYKKRTGHTVFYWPSRLVKWEKCSNWVKKNRFILI